MHSRQAGAATVNSVLGSGGGGGGRGSDPVLSAAPRALEFVSDSCSAAFLCNEVLQISPASGAVDLIGESFQGAWTLRCGLLSFLRH